MPFSLSLYLYKRLQEKSQKEFEKKNKILDSDSIRNLLLKSNKEEIIKIFNSAVVDHQSVNGAPYYLTPPIPPLFYHDSFKRCLIAFAVGQFSENIRYDRAKQAIEILDVLRDPSSTGYVQIFAWNALGQWANTMPGLFEPRRKDLMIALGGSTATLLGAILFLDKMLLTDQKQKVLEFLEQEKYLVKYKVQKALLGYFLVQNSYNADIYYQEAENDRNLCEFLNKCRKIKLFSSSYWEEGAREVGLIPIGQKQGLENGTQQADIAYKLKYICGNYLSAIGYYRKTYWR